VPASSEFQDERWNTDLTWHNPKLTQFWDVTAQVSFYDTHLQNNGDRLVYPPGTALPNAAGQLVAYPNGIIINPEFSERHARAELSAFYSGMEDHLLRFGIGYHYGDLYEVKTATNFGIDPGTGQPIPPDSPPVDVSDTEYSLQQESDRANWHGFIQDTWNFAPSW
jgi:iron complex outermembrane receptor protein